VRTSPSDRPKQKRTTLTYTDKRELDKLTTRLDALGAERTRLETELASSGSDVDRVVRLGEELAGVLDELDSAEHRWLELTERAEQLAAGGD
jgi:hypothetical protein